MTEFKNLSKEELSKIYEQTLAELKAWEEKGLHLDLTRGKPGQAQLDLTTDMLGVISGSCS